MSTRFPSVTVMKTMTLSESSEALRASFLALKSTSDLADILQCSLQQLVYWCRIAPASSRYHSFEILKRSGAKRAINAPTPVLRVLQRKLLTVLQAVYEPRAPVHGFTRSRGILTNAEQHCRRAWVLNVDLEDFFHSIHFGRVRGMFCAKPFLLPETVSTAIAQLSCHDGRLPQGAPTSPIISNIVCAKMDGELRRFAKESGAIYTRYADDLTFSVRRRGFPQSLGSVAEPEKGTFNILLSNSLQQIVVGNGFGVNDSKVRIQPWKRSQRVTGLVVNRSPNVPRRLVRRTRAMLHAWSRHGPQEAQAYFEKKYGGKPYNGSGPTPFQRHVRGCIAYIGQIRGRDDAVHLKLLSEYQRLIGDPMIGVPQAMTDNSLKRDVFICHASEDKKTVVEPLVDALEHANISAWYDRAEIRWGDSIVGKINQGLASSTYVIIVISASFMKKNWPKKEMQAAMSREIGAGRTCVLPLMVGSESEIQDWLQQMPLQADKLHLRWPGEPSQVVEALRGLLGTNGA